MNRANRKRSKITSLFLSSLAGRISCVALGFARDDRSGFALHGFGSSQLTSLLGFLLSRHACGFFRRTGGCKAFLGGAFLHLALGRAGIARLTRSEARSLLLREKRI